MIGKIYQGREKRVLQYNRGKTKERGDISKTHLKIFMALMKI